MLPTKGSYKADKEMKQNARALGLRWEGYKMFSFRGQPVDLSAVPSDRLSIGYACFMQLTAAK